jgi:hypothetical protein
MSSRHALPDLSDCLASQLGHDLERVTEPGQMSLRRLLAVLSRSDPSHLEENLASWLESELPHETLRRYSQLRQLICLVSELGREHQP